MIFNSLVYSVLEDAIGNDLFVNSPVKPPWSVLTFNIMNINLNIFKLQIKNLKFVSLTCLFYIKFYA